MKRLFTVILLTLLGTASTAWAQTSGNTGVVSVTGSSGNATFRLNKKQIPANTKPPHPLGDSAFGHPSNPYKADYYYLIYSTKVASNSGKDAGVVGAANFNVDANGKIKGRGIYWTDNRSFRIKGRVQTKGIGTMEVYYDKGGLHETWVIGKKALAIRWASMQQKGRSITGQMVPTGFSAAGAYSGSLSNKYTAFFAVDARGDTVYGLLRLGNSVIKINGSVTVTPTPGQPDIVTMNVSSSAANLNMTGTFAKGQFNGTWQYGSTGQSGKFTISKLR